MVLWVSWVLLPKSPENKTDITEEELFAILKLPVEVLLIKREQLYMLKRERKNLELISSVGKTHFVPSN